MEICRGGGVGGWVKYVAALRHCGAAGMSDDEFNQSQSRAARILRVTLIERPTRTFTQYSNSRNAHGLDHSGALGELRL